MAAIGAGPHWALLINANASKLEAAIDEMEAMRNTKVEAFSDVILVAGDVNEGSDPEEGAYSVALAMAPFWPNTIDPDVPLRVEVGDVAYLTQGHAMVGAGEVQQWEWVARAEVLPR